MQQQRSGYPFDNSFKGRGAPSQTRRIEALAKVGLFEGLSKRNLSRINEISRLRVMRADDVLMKQGDVGDTMMVVLDGTAVVRRGKRKVAECGPDQWVGEMALFDSEPRSATVVALEPMRVLEIPGGEFRKLLPKLPGVAEALLAALSLRLREANAAADF